MSVSPYELTAREALDMMASGSLTAEALMRSCLERIDAREGDVAAFQHLDSDLAMAGARAADTAVQRGPLGGIPVGIKDIFDTIDMPTEYGSPIYQGFQPRRDATAVARLREAGAVIAGKTTTTEFAGLQPTRTRNPRNLTHTPGGSSAGSAAAVADCMLPLAIGTQTGGSIIRPAAFCGVVGIKPSFGLIDRTGVRPAAEALDTVGTFSRTVADGALLLAVLAGDPELAVDNGVRFTPRIGICYTRQWDQASPDAQTSLEAAAVLLSAAGATVTQFALPESFDGLLESQGDIMSHGTLNSTLSEYLHAAGLLSPQTLAFCKAGEQVTAEAIRLAYTHLEHAAQQLGQAMQEVDILITPSTVGEAPLGLSSTGDALFNKLWTALKVPALTIPMGHGASGLPIGLQVVGKYRDDRRMLAAALWVEAGIN